MEEPGRVRSVADGRAEVEIEPGGACEKCGASGFCNWTGKRSRLVLARNDAGAEAGDAVVVETAEAGRLGSAGLVFGLPGGLMALGVVVGSLAWNDTGAAILAGVGLVLGLALLKLIDRRYRRSGRNLPVVTRRLEGCRPPAAGGAEGGQD
jgi:positive regulator of sigma E activity